MDTMSKLLNLEAFKATSEELKKYIDKLVSDSANNIVIQADTYLKFPVVGQKNAIYIDTTTNTIYRWDDANLKYYIVIDNYENVDTIDGCGK